MLKNIKQVDKAKITFWNQKQIETQNFNLTRLKFWFLFVYGSQNVIWALATFYVFNMKLNRVKHKKQLIKYIYESCLRYFLNTINFQVPLAD